MLWKSLPLAFALVTGGGATWAQTAITYSNPGVTGFPAQMTGFTTSFANMYQSTDGRIGYQITMSIPVEIEVPILRSIKDPNADPTTRLAWINRTATVYQYTYYWATPWGTFTPRAITRDQVLGRGVVTSTQLDSAINALIQDGVSYGTPTYQESAVPTVDGTTQHLYDTIIGTSASYRKQGALNLLVNIPAAGNWKLAATNALGEERSARFALPAGPQVLQVTGIEAGNGLAALTYLDATNGYHRQVPVIVRKDTPGIASMPDFTMNQNDSKRFRIYSLTTGQNSQDTAGSLPLVAGKDAMVRVMAFDSMGLGDGDQGTTMTVNLSALNSAGQQVWSQSFPSPISSLPLKTGKSFGRYLAPAIPGSLIQPGLTVVAKLLTNGATPTLLDQVALEPTFAQPRHIVIHGYDVRPFRGDSGCPLARSPDQMNTWIVPYINEVFPYSTVEYRYEGKVWLMDYGQYAARGVMTTGVAMMLMNAFQGMHQTDNNASTEHLYMALINEKYTGTSVTGMAWYGYRGLALSRVWDGEWPNSSQWLGYNIAHEMGHCFDLEHAPSVGADSNFLSFHVNRVDPNFQYGGAGLSGGWGYSALGKYFLAEDAQTVSSRSPHWDPMSYTNGGGRYLQSTRFNDLYTARLRPDIGQLPATLPVPPVISTSASTSTGIPVFDASSALQLQNWALAQDSGANYASQMLAPLSPTTSTTDPLQGIDPATVDADDPTAPVLVVTASPVIPGVTVPLQ
jgi:hypothetical protein